MNNKIFSDQMICKRYPNMFLRLFILRSGKRTSHPDYHIAYGVASQTPDCISSPTISQFTELGSFGGKKHYVAVLTIVCETARIIGIHNDLSIGLSLRKSLERWEVDCSKLDADFDVKFHQPSCTIPWHHEKIIKQQVTYCKITYMTDSIAYMLPCGEYEQEKFIKSITTYLSQKTGIPCKKLENRIGNMELLLAPDRNIYGKSLVKGDIDKKAPTCVHIKVLPELTEHCDSVCVNTRIQTDGGIICDTLQNQIPISGKEMLFDFPTQTPVQMYEVKVWIGRNNEYALAHQSVSYIIRNSSINMEIIRQTIRTSNEWLDKIRDTMPKKKHDIVDKAATIQHTSVEKHEISTLPQTKSLYGKRKEISPRFRTNDRFFPLGWNRNIEEQGALSFLEWFRERTHNARRVFIQDPYFEDVALYFIASSNIQCEYTILTQTRLKTNTDGTDHIQQQNEPLLRRQKIIDIIKAYPILFKPLKLVIKDISASGPKLHDRYLMFTDSEGHVEGYALSNSFQGATIKLPLLVTQIGDSALEPVLQHVMQVYTDNHTETIYDHNQKENIPTGQILEIADKGFYNWWRKKEWTDILQNPYEILNDIFQWNTTEKISTAGYCLANIPDAHAYEILNAVTDILRSDSHRIEVLKDFILDKHYSHFPVGFINKPHQRDFKHSYSWMLELPYSEIVTTQNVHDIEYAVCETNTYGVWGQYFACQLLIKVAPGEAIDVLKKLQYTLVRVKQDKTITPIYQVTNMLMAAIFESSICNYENKLMTNLLTDKQEWCRGLGALILLNKATERDFRISSYRKLFWNDDERCIFCHTALSLHPEVANKTILYQWLNETLTSLSNPQLIIDRFLTLLRKSYSQEDIKEYITQIILPLISNKIVNRDIINRTLIEELFDRCILSDVNSCLQDNGPVALYLLHGDISHFINKAINIIKQYDRCRNSQAIITNDAISQLTAPITKLNKLISNLLTYDTPNLKSSSSQLQNIQKDIITRLEQVSY